MRAVLAHWAHPDAIRHLDAANLQGSEELWNRLARLLMLSRSARDGNLLRSEEGRVLGSDIVDWLRAFGLLLRGGGSGSRNRDAVMRVRDTLSEIGRHVANVCAGRPLLGLIGNVTRESRYRPSFKVEIRAIDEFPPTPSSTPGTVFD